MLIGDVDEDGHADVDEYVYGNEIWIECKYLYERISICGPLLLFVAYRMLRLMHIKRWEGGRLN